MVDLLGGEHPLGDVPSTVMPLHEQAPGPVGAYRGTSVPHVADEQENVAHPCSSCADASGAAPASRRPGFRPTRVIMPPMLEQADDDNRRVVRRCVSLVLPG